MSVLLQFLQAVYWTCNLNNAASIYMLTSLHTLLKDQSNVMASVLLQRVGSERKPSIEYFVSGMFAAAQAGSKGSIWHANR